MSVKKSIGLNPQIQSDILLFQRKKAQPTRSSKKKASKSDPIVPDAIEEMNIEDFIVGELDADNHLDIFDETRMAAALDEYVSKEQTQAINESVAKLLQKQQAKLIKQEPRRNEEGALVLESEELAAKKKNRRQHAMVDDVAADTMSPGNILANKDFSHTRRAVATGVLVESVPSDADSDTRNSDDLLSRTPKNPSGRKRYATVDDDGDHSEERIAPTRRSRSSRRAQAAPTKINYMEDDSCESIGEEKRNPPVRQKKTNDVTKAAKPRPSLRATSRKSLSQPKLSFVPLVGNGKSTSAKRRKAVYSLDSGDDEDPDDSIKTSDEDWSAAKTDTFE